jgi:hypothetical protein
MLNDAYCTVTEANTVNNTDAWNVLLEAEKETALKWGRVYLDSYYICPNITYSNLDPNDEDDLVIINVIKAANAVLADKYANGELFEASGTAQAKIAEKQVKAGSVSTRTRYADPTTNATYDPFPDVTSLLSGYCQYKKTGLVIDPVIRG